jgi:hypothetical protein
MSEQMTVLVNRASIFWLPAMRGEPNAEGARPSLCGKLKLIPGTNIISRKRWEMSADHPAVKVYIELGTLVLDPSAAEKTEHTHTPDNLSGLKGLSIPKAAVWIEACSELRQLEKWRNADDRKGIHAAIDARIAELNEDEPDEGDDDSLADEDFE